jgi:hypothetical protein
MAERRDKVIGWATTAIAMGVLAGGGDESGGGVAGTGGDELVHQRPFVISASILLNWRPKQDVKAASVGSRQLNAQSREPGEPRQGLR